MAQYLLSVHMVEGEPVPEADLMQEMFAAVDRFNDELKASGAWVFAGGLHPADTATTVQVDGTTTDGPFAESKEQLGGFWIVDVADLDAALSLAKKGASACRGAVEVRPFEDEPEAT